MVGKQKSVYTCQNCGWETPRWVGQCTSCNTWNSLVEQVAQSRKGDGSPSRAVTVTSFTDLSSWDSGDRVSTSIQELDRVLGGDAISGLVPGEVILLGGEPGVGKSTLLTQVALGMLTNSVQKKQKSLPIYYVAGEESPQQVALRIRRLLASQESAGSTKKGALDAPDLTKLSFITSTDVDEIVSTLSNKPAQLIIIDSIQTLTTGDLSGSAGSVGQVRECADRLTQLAKQIHVPMFLVGHVTKEGKLAGPMILEHLVDTVLELKGEKTSELRLLRSQKNRFGATDEVGVFRMTELGYQEVINPSEYFLETREKLEPGSAVSCVIEGTRPLLIEVQALTIPSYLPQPRRVGRGISANRLQILTAVLEKHAKIPLSKHDVFVSLAGGYESREPPLDLAICMAIASSYKNQPTPAGCVYVGEVGLLGEVRMVPLLQKREKEAKRLGYPNLVSRKTATSIDKLVRFSK
ncbi:DNA repair protein RadA [Candidatus Woesebacteria bacterium]|nr:DNA repair protein RadA [Candidatus Woesebacteria bacterium]